MRRSVQLDFVREATATLTFRRSALRVLGICELVKAFNEVSKAAFGFRRVRRLIVPRLLERR